MKEFQAFKDTRLAIRLSKPFTENKWRIQDETTEGTEAYSHTNLNLQVAVSIYLKAMKNG